MNSNPRRKLDRRPPELTGDASVDTRRIVDYLEKMREDLNVILSQIYKAVNEGGGA